MKTTRNVCSDARPSPALSAIAHWYNKKRASAMGIVTAGSSVGAVVFPIALNNLIPAVGFPWVSGFCGMINDPRLSK